MTAKYNYTITAVDTRGGYSNHLFYQCQAYSEDQVREFWFNQYLADTYGFWTKDKKINWKKLKVYKNMYIRYIQVKRGSMVVDENQITFDIG